MSKNMISEWQKRTMDELFKQIKKDFNIYNLAIDPPLTQEDASVFVCGLMYKMAGISSLLSMYARLLKEDKEES